MKSIISVILTCLLSSTIFAQQNKFNIGIEGGPSRINLRGENVGIYNDPGIGFSGGLTFQYNFPKVLSLRTNLSFERKGSLIRDVNIHDASGNFLGVSAIRHDFDYITMPLLLRATFGKKVNFFINTGPFFSYLVRVQYVTQETFGLPKIPSRNEASNYNQFDAGLALGLGFAVPIKSKILLSLELRNNTGFCNINKPVNSSRVINTSSTNLLIGTAYKFGTRNKINLHKTAN